MSSTAAATNPQKGYTSIEVLIITYTDRQIDNLNAEYLEWVFKSFGYRVERITENELDINPRQLEKTWDKNTQAWVRRFIKRTRKSSNDAHNKKLYLVCYLGHGSIRSNNHLYACNSGQILPHQPPTVIRFDLTEIQHMFRDETPSDVLFLLSCCYGTHNGMNQNMPNPGSLGGSEPNKIMETVTAGPGITYASPSWWDFTRRFGLNLLRLEDKSVPKAVTTAHQMSTHAVCTGSPGFHHLNFGPSSIILPTFLTTLSNFEWHELDGEKDNLYLTEIMEERKNASLRLEIDALRANGWRD